MASGSQNNTSFQAQKWTNTRAFTIGATSKNVDGTSAVEWTKDNILGASTSAYFLRGDKSWSNALNGSLHLYGTTIGNTATDMKSGTAGLFSWGDTGPKITFDTNATPGNSQAGALIFTDHDTAGTGVSWHFVSNQSDWNVTSKRFHARTNISIGTTLPNTSAALYISGNQTITGTLNGFNFYSSSTAVDANDLRTNVGFYSVANSITNAATTNHAMLMCVGNVGTPAQYFFSDTSVLYIYKRWYSSNAWSSWTKIYAGHADALTTARTIWGQSFNGTANISGNLSGVGGSLYAAANVTLLNFLTSSGQALYGKFGGVGISADYSNTDTSTYGLDIYNRCTRFRTANAALGIATSSPYKIGTDRKTVHIQCGNASGTGVNDGYSSAITFGDGSAYAGIYYQSSDSYGSRLIFGTTSSYANGTYGRAIINHSGYVGIGTMEPAYLLDVAGNARVRETLYISTNNTTGGGIYFSDDGDIVDLNDAYCSMRFSSGVRIFSANKGGSAVITLANSGSITASNTIYANGGYLKSTCNSVTVQIGGQNSSWCHFTGAPLYYFDQSIYANGALYVYNTTHHLDSTAIWAYRWRTTNLELAELDANRMGLCNHGQGTAKGLNVGSLLISNAWADASNVPTNGLYCKGVATHATTIVQTSGNLNGETTSNTNHAIKMGHTGDDVCIFYEYGGLWRFYTSQSNSNTQRAYIDSQGVHNAVWNDFAEYRKSSCKEPGRVVIDDGKGCLHLCNIRLAAGARIISDTFGCSVGISLEQDTPIGVGGRVLAYPYQDRNNYHVGDAVCSAPEGTIDIMTRDEIMMYPERILGIVSEVPEYEEWRQIPPDSSEGVSEGVLVNGRIWIYVK